MKNPVINNQHFSVIPLQTINLDESKKIKPLYVVSNPKAFNPVASLRSKVLSMKKEYVFRPPVKKIINNISENSDKKQIDWFNNYE